MKKKLRFSMLILLLLLLLGHSSISNIIADDTLTDASLIAHYSFDAGSGIQAGDGILLNGAGWTDGLLGKALKLNSRRQYVSVPTSENGTLNPELVTIAAWINPQEVGGQHHYIISKHRDCCDRPGQGGYGLRINKTTGLLRGEIWRNSTKSLLAVNGRSPIVLNAWSHVAMVFDGSEIRIYINGLLDGTSHNIGSDIIQPSTKNLSIGVLSYNAPFYYGFLGLIDEMRLYNRPLAETEINKLFLVQLPPDNLPGFFVSVNGSDDNPGTQNEPWRTIQNSINKLLPGDILNVFDGVYAENVEPYVSGTAEAPIVIRAITPFNVTIDGDTDGDGVGNGRALKIRDVSYLTFEGFKFINGGEGAPLSINGSDNRNGQWPWPVGELDNLPENFKTHHITLRKIAVRGSCLLKNCTGMLIARSNDITLEDAWIYGAGRYTLETYGSRRITIRRVVIRWDQWIGSLSKPNDPRNAMGVYNTFDSLFENIILIDSGMRPLGTGGSKGTLLIAGGNNGNTSAFVNSRNNQFYGLILFNNRGKSIEISSKTGAHDNNYFENSVVFNDTQNSIVYDDTHRAITLNGSGVTNSTFNHITLLDSKIEGYANWINGSKTFGNIMTNSIVANGLKRAFRGQLTRSDNIVFNNRPNYFAGQSRGVNSLEIDPSLVHAFENNTSPLIDNPGDDGKPRGASIIYRYNDGIETTEKLWPWLYQEKIRQDFCDLDYLTEIGRTGDNSSPWCDSNKTLTNYLWEGLTSTPCPEGVCNGVRAISDV